MHVFRFNPVTDQWVLLGVPLPEPDSLQVSQFLEVGKRSDFKVANHPGNFFVLDPAEAKRIARGVHADQPPVGEYELLLYTGERTFAAWRKQEWEKWLLLLQQRLLQMQHNMHLHYVSISLPTAKLDSVKEYQRVGDLIATSHPILVGPGPFDIDLREKIKEKEYIFTVDSSSQGFLQVPTAPLFEQELWYLPSGSSPRIEQASSETIRACAETLAHTLGWLQAEFPRTHYVLKVHTSFSDTSHSATWWLQIHKDEAPGFVHTLPEIWMRKLQLGGLA